MEDDIKRFRELFPVQDLVELETQAKRATDDHDSVIITKLLESDTGVPSRTFLERQLRRVHPASPLASFCEERVTLDSEKLESEDDEFLSFQTWVFLSFCEGMEEKLRIGHPHRAAILAIENRIVDQLERILGRRDHIPEIDFVEEAADMFEKQWEFEHPWEAESRDAD